MKIRTEGKLNYTNRNSINIRGAPELMRILLIFIFFLFSCRLYPIFPNGGYEFPVLSENVDTNYYYYPIKDIVSKKDSFRISEYHLYYRPFNEPNISIKPLKTPVFRLVYSSAFGNSIIFVISENQITIKEGNPTIIYSEDNTKLDSIEQMHLALLNRRYPIDTTDKSPRQKAYLDSMIRKYPQLLDVTYYKSLKEKILTRNTKNFEYTYKQLNISSFQYYDLINTINASGYWSLPYEFANCGAADDGDGFSLEANANSRYNLVQTNTCQDDTTAFAKACQKIIDLADLNKKIRLSLESAVDTIKVNH